MTESTGPLLSVRAEAHRTVMPDYVVLSGRLVASRTSKVEALQAAAAALSQLTDALSGLGGTPLAAPTIRNPLTGQPARP